MPANKSLGQHWLADNEALLAVVKAADIKESDTVLEIGPGLGYLTDKLVKTGANILALEVDEDLLPDLHKKYEYTAGRVKIIQQDIRRYDLGSLPAGYKICANIPYYLSANLFRMLTDSASKPAVASLLVQKEVAQKLASGSKRSMLSVLVQAWYDVSLGRLVEAALFEPPPKVDSMVLILKLNPKLQAADWQNFVRVVKIGFSNPRKKLSTNLSSGLGITKQAAIQMLTDIGKSEDIRAEKLGVTDWLLLAQTQ